MVSVHSVATKLTVTWFSPIRITFSVLSPHKWSRFSEVFLGSTWWKWKPSLSAMFLTPLKEVWPKTRHLYVWTAGVPTFLYHVRDLRKSSATNTFFLLSVVEFIDEFTDKVVYVCWLFVLGAVQSHATTFCQRWLPFLRLAIV